jgi:LacI family gluconate utilization system Gnt-I transcriptional repressor
MGRKRTKSGKIRLTEVAKLAGVSPITASRFFRNPDALSLAKRERVDSAVKELGYVPNLAARALASHRTEVIGVVIPSLTNSVFADVLRGIYDASEQSRYSIQLANTRYSILQEEKLLRLFRAQKPAGLIVTGINQTPESRNVLETMDCPVTQIMEIGDSPVDMMVGFSHYDASFAAISHIIEQGRRRIGFLGARMDPRVQRRLDGYRDAMKAAGLSDPNLVVTTSIPTTVTLGGTLFVDLLAQTSDIDAVFCVNDDLALGVLFE